MRISVDLPEPFGPEQAVDLPGAHRQADVVERDEVAELAPDAARRRWRVVGELAARALVRVIAAPA